MKRNKLRGGVWEYLGKIGVLELGDASAIEQAKKEYWRAYRRRYNKEHRKRYTITVTAREQKEVEGAAKRHNRKPTTFIKEALFAYIRSAFVVPDRAAVDEIRIQFARMYRLLQSLEEEREDGKLESALLLLEKLEEAVLRSLTAAALSTAPSQSNAP